MEIPKIIKNWINWLDRHGGLNALDVLLDTKGLHVLMGDGKGGDTKVYIPTIKDEFIFT